MALSATRHFCSFRCWQEVSVHTHRTALVIVSFYCCGVVSRRANWLPTCCIGSAGYRHILRHQSHRPYRWMEDRNAPEFINYMLAQGHYARGVLDNIPGHEDLQKRIAKHTGGGIIVGSVQIAGGRIFT
jgi:hypothetical protein